MSPRRMDISSLLRDPSPPHQDRPALPASLLNILNTPSNAQPRHQPDRTPFLALDALVHVASEERRRITAGSPSSLPDDHDRHFIHHGYPYPTHPHSAPLQSPLSLSQDNSRAHKRPRDAGPPSPPRSPTSSRSFPFVPGPSASPSTRHHLSASPTTSYPTLRSQPILEPPRSAPAGPVNDARFTYSFPLQHASPFSPPPLLPHSSPRINSPHRHSPQLLRSHYHSSPTHTSALPAEPDAMSPRYGYGPRMAGGIDVLSNDPSPVRDPPRPDFSFCQSPKRDLPTEWLASEPQPEHAKYEPKLSPLSVRAFSLDGNGHQARVPSHKLEVQESVFHRERTRTRPPHFPLLDAATDIPQSLAMPAKEPDFTPVERHPIRVWEEQPSMREVPRRASPARIPGIISGHAEGRAWLAVSEDMHSERPAKGEYATVSTQDIVLTPSLATCEEPPLPHHPVPGPLTSDLHTPVERSRLDSQTSSPIPMQSQSQAYLSLTSLLNSSTPPASASPVLDLHLKNFDESELPCERSEMQVDASAGVLPVLSDPIATELVSDKAEAEQVGEVANASIIANPPPPQRSPERLHSADPDAFETSTQLGHANASQGTSRSPSQQHLFVPLPTRDEHRPPPGDIPIPLPIQPEPKSGRSSEPEYTTTGEPPVSEQGTMDVDDELLSLVEDRPTRAPTATPKARIDSKLTPPIMAGQVTGTGSELSSQPSDGASSLPSFQPIPRASLVTDEEKDRASMPPPAPRNRKAEKDKANAADNTAVASKKKKDGTSKTTAKPKQPAKPRPKPAPKPKAKSNGADPSLKAGIPKCPVNINARSRSTSVIPSVVDDVIPEPEADESEKEDDKLYCICKTRYDEDRMMIACDRCDEWFHTLCVDIPDLEIDLVDQFICPPCMQKHPHLRTTWKRRCFFGLQHDDPSSPEACHKPSRGAFSKYCSDDCGIKSLQTRITQWEKSGGARDRLWENVKNATKREGVVVCAATNGVNLRTMDVDSNNSEAEPLDSAAKRRAEREVTRLNTRLEEVVKERELMKRELDMVTWRERVVELASERAGKVDECGWDQRLCFGEEEWADFGQEVLESYEEERMKVESGDDTMPLEATSAMLGEWWCSGKKKCERHAGWQKLRAAEASFDKETKEGLLLKLTTQEREIRKCIEDILYPQPTGTLQAAPPEVQFNGSEKPHLTGHVLERGKKRSS